MSSPKRPYILGVITALPILFFLPTFLLGFVSSVSGSNAPVIKFAPMVAALLAVLLHTILYFYYLVKLQNTPAVKPDHQTLWLLLLMPLGGQQAFWYLYLWKPAASHPDDLQTKSKL
jgi:hypothetical protein